MRTKNPLYKTPREITQEVLKEMFDYVDGNLIYKVRPACRVQIGDIAGTVSNRGYLFMVLAYKQYQIHNLIWLWHKGHWPKPGYELDHISKVKSDNRIENLREATRSENNFNTDAQSNSTTGLKGVSKYGDKYRAHGRLQGKSLALGTYPTAEEASAAYQAFAKANHGEFYRAPS